MFGMRIIWLHLPSLSHLHSKNIFTWVNFNLYWGHTLKCHCSFDSQFNLSYIMLNLRITGNSFLLNRLHYFNETSYRWWNHFSEAPTYIAQITILTKHVISSISTHFFKRKKKTKKLFFWINIPVTGKKYIY